jgi:hypothetical protein
MKIYSKMEVRGWNQCPVHWTYWRIDVCYTYVRSKYLFANLLSYILSKTSFKVWHTLSREPYTKRALYVQWTLWYVEIDSHCVLKMWGNLGISKTDTMICITIWSWSILNDASDKDHCYIRHRNKQTEWSLQINCIYTHTDKICITST